MKVIVVNRTKDTEEFIECKYIKIEEDRMLLVSDRTISILTKGKEVTTYYPSIIRESFLLNKVLFVYIQNETIKITSENFTDI